MERTQALILIVDDDIAVRESLKFSLEIEGWIVGLCAGGSELLRHPGLRSADCVILDYKMPGMDGFAVLDALAALQVTVPFIMITADANDNVRRRAAKAGVHSVLEKPVLHEALANGLRDLHAAIGESVAAP